MGALLCLANIRIRSKDFGGRPHCGSKDLTLLNAARKTIKNSPWWLKLRITLCPHNTNLLSCSQEIPFHGRKTTFDHMRLPAWSPLLLQFCRNFFPKSKKVRGVPDDIPRSSRTITCSCICSGLFAVHSTEEAKFRHRLPFPRVLFVGTRENQIVLLAGGFLTTTTHIFTCPLTMLLMSTQRPSRADAIEKLQNKFFFFRVSFEQTTE